MVRSKSGAAVVLAAICGIVGSCAGSVATPQMASPSPISTPTTLAATLITHHIQLDGQGKLVSWVTPQNQAYGRVVDLAWHRLERIRTSNDRMYLHYATFDPKTMSPGNGPMNNAGLFAMLTDSGLGYYAYSGDTTALDLVREALDAQIDRGTTPATGYSWPSTPYASADPGAQEYRGASDAGCSGCGSGDGVGVLEPDKAGEIGLAYVKFYETTGESRYLDAALAVAGTLAAKVRSGDAKSSPWPFRVEALSGRVRYDYTANALGPVMLFDELMRIHAGDQQAFSRARQIAWSWMFTYPFQNHHWSQYFEDGQNYPDPMSNANQYIPLRLAEYLIQHPETDSTWKQDATALIRWVASTFGVDYGNQPGRQWGATVMSEQIVDMDKMGSHTSRYAAANALLAQATGDKAALEEAYRSFNWATYMCSSDGLVIVGPHVQYWFSDGYGDYIRHFLIGMGAIPEWAPAGESHLLHSDSTVQSITYGQGRVGYTTFDTKSKEELRLAYEPQHVTDGGASLPRVNSLHGDGYTVTALGGGGFLVEVQHSQPGPITIAA